MPLDIQFYHLTSTPLDRALPKLLEKALQAGLTARVKLETVEKAESMNVWLWAYNPDSFLPHGTAEDGNAQQQPVYLTAANDNPAAAPLLVVTDGSTIEEDTVTKRALDVFDGTDDAAVARARERYAAYRAAGHSVSYVRQNAAGGWEKQGT